MNMNKEISWEIFHHIEEDNDLESPGILYSGTFSQNVNDYKDYNLYIAHCNFYITADIVNDICATEGIESVDILSPYRFRISIGKLFSPNDVLVNIKDKLTKA